MGVTEPIQIQIQMKVVRMVIRMTSLDVFCTLPEYYIKQWLVAQDSHYRNQYDCSLSFWLQMSEPITHMDTDNCMTIHHK